MQATQSLFRTSKNSGPSFNCEKDLFLTFWLNSWRKGLLLNRSFLGINFDSIFDKSHQRKDYL